MKTFREVIESYCYYYPALHQSQAEVMSFIFFTLGNGMIVKDGKLHDFVEGEPKAINESTIEELFEEDIVQLTRLFAGDEHRGRISATNQRIRRNLWKEHANMLYNPDQPFTLYPYGSRNREDYSKLEYPDYEFYVNQFCDLIENIDIDLYEDDVCKKYPNDGRYFTNQMATYQKNIDTIRKELIQGKNS